MSNTPRIYCDAPLTLGQRLDLPEQAVRHIQVLRMQPGQQVYLFPGGEPHSQHEYVATITAMGRHSVQVQIDACAKQPRENRLPLHIALGMPSNERMDWLVEKATELGVAHITPLMTERSVLRLAGERAHKRRAHWQAIASAACEQSGRNQVPFIEPPLTLPAYLQTWAQAQPQTPHPQTPHPQAHVKTPARVVAGAQAFPRLPAEASANALAPANANTLTGTSVHRRYLLSLSNHSRRLDTALLHSLVQCQSITILSGPEGGLTPQEEEAALAAGFAPLHLGPRILRAETAPLAVAAIIGLLG